MSNIAPETTTRVVRLCVDTSALTDRQRDLLARHSGTARAVWNWGLALRNAQHDELTAMPAPVDCHRVGCHYP